MRFGVASRSAFLGLVGLGLAAGVVLARASSATDCESGRIAYLAYTEGFWQVWLLSCAEDSSRQLTYSPGDKTHVSWYPVGTALLVTRLNGTIFRLELAGGVEQPIETQGVPCAGAALSPDGERIACSRGIVGRDERYNHDLWILKADGSEGRQLTHMPGMQHEPAWSPDGRWVYFLSDPGSPAHDLWRIAPAGKSLEQLTAGRTYHFDIAVSSTGDLLFSSDQRGDYEIWLQRRGERPEPVTDHPGLDARPAWSPSEDQFVYESVAAAVPNLWIRSLHGGEPRPLTHHRLGARAPAWWGAPEAAR